MKVKYGSLNLRLRTLYSKYFAKADLRRWSDIDSFDLSWAPRTEMIARLVAPHSTVIEFGAGRRYLEKLLDPSCRYVPSDLVDRGPGTIVCDLNQRPLPDLTRLRPAVATFAGVFEYIAELPAIPHWLAAFAPVCLASYECAQTKPGTWARWKESSRRTSYGWVNTYDENQLEALFRQAGFQCVRRETWTTKQGNERIFAFELPNPATGQRPA